MRIDQLLRWAAVGMLLLVGVCGDEWKPISDPCALQPCQHGGHCSLAENTIVCACPAGYTGRRCEMLVTPDPCMSLSCMNGGTCGIRNDLIECVCPTGYTGPRCETPVLPDPCAAKPCQNGGTCSKQSEEFRCMCPPEYSGTRCETPSGFVGFWPQGGFDVQRSGFQSAAVGIHSVNIGDLSERWNVATASTVNSAPSVMGNKVFYGTYSGAFQALDLSTGSTLWSANSGQTEMGNALSGDLVIVATRCTNAECGRVTAYAQDNGAVRWKWEAPAHQVTDPVVGDNVVYVGLHPASGETVVQALAANTGTPLWTSKTGGMPALSATHVFAAGWTTRALRALSRTTGELLWSAPLGAEAARPTVAGPYVFVHTSDGKLFAYPIDGCGAADCPPVWQATVQGTGDVAPPAVANDRVYLGAGSSLYAFRANGCGAASCDPEWTLTTSCSSFSPQPTIAGDLIYVACGNDYLYVVDAASGASRRVFRFGSRNYPMRSQPVVVGSRLLIAATFAFKFYMYGLP